MNSSITWKGILIVITFFLLTSLTNAAFAQDKKTITINEKSITLAKLFSYIEANTQYSIAYNKSMIDLAKSVSISVQDEPVEKILPKVLENTKLTYKTQGYHIIVFPDERKTATVKKKEKPEEPIVEDVVELFDDGTLYLQVDTAGNVHVTTINDIYPESLEIYPIYIEPKEATQPCFLIKNNLLQDAALARFANINIGVEARLSEKLTLDFPVSFNPWTFSDNKKFKHCHLQPELRYWFDKSYSKYFVGIHVHWSYYNVANAAPFVNENFRYKGWLAGGGISGGYRWDLNNRWGIEAALGLGYSYFHYDKFDYPKDGTFLRNEHKNRFGLTKSGITISYRLK